MTSWLRRLRALRERRLVRWGMDALVFVGVLLAISAWQTRHHVRGEAPDFALESLDGQEITRADLAGRPTLLVFWAPWCGVCRVESANVSRVQSLVGEHARVISVASDYESLASVREYVEKQGVDYPVLLGGRTTSRQYRVAAFPTAYFLDAEGRIKGSAVGYTTTAGLLARLLF